MRSAIVGFVVGAAWLQIQASLPQYSTIFFLLLCAGLLGCGIARISSSKVKILLLSTLGILLGFVWAALFAHYYLSSELPKDLEGQDITLVGTIDNMPNYFERGVRFHFAIEKVLAVNGAQPAELQTIPSKLALSWYSAFNADEVQKVLEVQPGERWQFTVRLRRPHGNANPQGFDYEVWLLEQNIRATGYIRQAPSPEQANLRLDHFVFSFNNVVERGRSYLRERVQKTLQGKPYAGVIVALVVGDQRAISQSDWTVFNRTGVSHLISISGLHITMVAALFAGLIFSLWRRSFFTSARLPLILPAQKAAALAGAIAALIYVLLAGSGLPAQRTLIMLSVVAIALWCGRITSVSHVLCLALGLVVLLDPWAVLGPGFWLSFAAVAAILYVSVGRALGNGSRNGDLAHSRWRTALHSASLTQYAVTLGLVPLTVLLFGQTSLVSPVANAIAIPLVSFLVTPLALLGSVLPAPLSAFCLGFVHFLIAELAQLLNWLSGFSLAVWSSPIPDWWMFGLALIGTLWLLAPRGWPARYLGFFAWLPLVLNAPAHPRAGEMWVTAFDVGQGMALLIETEQHRFLYDTGPFYAPESDGGNRVILPYLRARGINQLDGMMISHSDMDHAGGALSIMKEIKVAQLTSSLPSEHSIVNAAAVHKPCIAGHSWQWDSVDFEVLHPTAASYASDKWKPNARSCTLKITVNGLSILLPGDIEAVQEAELLYEHKAKLAADVLLAPHHGSGTSSTLAFLQAVQPQIALFQVGYRNRYRHPKQEVFDRYGELGIQRLRTDASGAISVHFGLDITVNEYRGEHARYWYGR